MASSAGKRSRSKIVYTETNQVEETEEPPPMRRRKSSGKKSTKAMDKEGDKGTEEITKLPIVPAPSILQSLQQTNALDLLMQMKDGQLIEVRTDQTLLEIFGILNSNKILSAPIYDVNSKKHIGFVDMVDLVTATVDLLEPIWAEAKVEGEGQEAQDLENIRFQDTFNFTSISAKALADISKRDPFVCVKVNDNALDIAKLLCKCHRIAVEDAEGNLKGIVSQMGFVEYLTEQHAGLWNELVKDLEVKDLKLPDEVHTICQDRPAIEAFKIMTEKRVSGIGVVDQQGNLKDAISVSDLMLWSEWIVTGTPIRFSNLNSLRDTITDFLVNSRAQHDVEQRVKPVECGPKRNVGECIQKMLFNGVHRIFVVEPDQHPVSVVTFGDILAHLCQE